MLSRSLHLPMIGLVLLALALLPACGGSGSTEDATDGGPDQAFDAPPDGQLDVPADPGPGEADAPTPDAADEVEATDTPAEQADVDATDTAEVDVPLPELPTRAPLATPADPLAGQPVVSCAVFQEEKCEAGTLKRCSAYDAGTGAFVADADLDGMLRRAWLYDRWRDLYHHVDGELTERVFTTTVPAGTPEAVWGSPEYFARYEGGGDSGIWTGWATVAAILRYANTGTEADYQRMEGWVRGLVMKWDVTGIPGYLSRSHYLLMPPGGPNSTEHFVRWGLAADENWMHYDIPNPAGVEGLPAAYVEGLPDADGNLVKGEARWNGRPSIDQVSGSETALPMAYALLRDEGLKAKIRTHLTCYLKRLQRVELVNLQQNPEALQAFMDYFASGQLEFDADDIDFSKLDRIVGYVQRQINSKNEADFDTSCPDTIQMTPWRTIDAAAPAFVGQLLQFVLDMSGYESERENGLDHYYFPSIRGGDAMHLMHHATIAYYLTGDEQYRRFLYEELLPNVKTVEVAYTAGAFDPPRTCKKWFGDQITFGPWWAFLHLLGESPLLTDLQRAFDVEFWQKLMADAGNVDFNVMYAGAVPESLATGRAQALAYALEMLPLFGGNGGVLDDPRRQYTHTEAEVLAAAPEGTLAVCPTQHEIELCEAEIDFMGVSLPGLVATNTCTGSEWECTFANGKCAPKEASVALPPHLRNFTDYLWQRNPFDLGAYTAVEGGTQYPGSDYSVPYWNARRYGFIEAGQGQVLAWEPKGDCGE
jgi:hypothetical protein